MFAEFAEFWFFNWDSLEVDEKFGRFFELFVITWECVFLCLGALQNFN